MFTPVHKPGMEGVVPEGVKINVNDVIGIYRDEFKDILTNDGKDGRPLDPNHDAFYND